MRVMITGATGFVGFHTAQALLAAGHEVSLLVRSEKKMQTLTAPPESLGDTRYTHAFHHVLKCIKEGQKPTATVDDGIVSVALAEALYESAHTGKKVNIAL